MKKIFINISVAISSFCIAILSLESLLTLSGFQKQTVWWKWATEEHSQSKFMLDTKRIYKLRPSTQNLSENTMLETVDSKGFRSQPCKDDTASKILFMGDSYTWGHNVLDNETYPYYFSNLLHDEDSTYCVINAGVQGYSFNQEYIYFLELVKSINPSLIIWTLEDGDLVNSLSNDIIGLRNEKIFVKGALHNKLFLEGIITSKLGRIFPNSKLVNLITYNLQRISWDEKFFKQQTIVFPLLIQDILNTSVTENIPILFVLVPDKLKFIRDEENEPPDYYISNQLRNMQRNFIDVNDVLLASLDQNLQNEASISSYKNIIRDRFNLNTFFLPNDTHLSAKGNEILAEIVYRKIRLERMINLAQ